VKNRFQSLPFKCNLQRYNVAGEGEEQQKSFVQVNWLLADGPFDQETALAVVGLCTLNQVDP
jgi:hypothetical protein